MKEERTKSGLGAGLEGFFQGLRVVELAGVLAGPAVGMFFAELGARVIKIENSRTGGDITRQWKLSAEPEDSSVSAYYCSVNWNKEVRLLDLETREAQVEVHELVAGADLVISNFKPDSARRLRMDADTLRDLNGRLIYAQIDAFGPDEQRPAFDVVLQAEAGYLYMSGEPGRPPVKMPVALIDLLAAHQLKEAVLVALLQRERSGKGCTVRTSLFESALASLANQATNWLMGGLVPQPIGTQHPNIAPYGDIVHTADGKPLVLAVGTDRQFAALCHCRRTFCRQRLAGLPPGGPIGRDTICRSWALAGRLGTSIPAVRRAGRLHSRHAGSVRIARCPGDDPHRTAVGRASEQAGEDGGV